MKLEEGQRPATIVRGLTLFRQINLFLFPLLYSRSREQPIFLQLKDYFWVKTPSTYELPFGTKGSGKLFLSSVGKHLTDYELL
jgi:hypothetical protein